MKRQKITNRKKDKKIFRKTATKTKALNESALSFRGGIRL